MQYIGKIPMLLAFSLSLIGCLLDEGGRTQPMMEDGELLEISDDSEHPMTFVDNTADVAPSATTQYQSYKKASGTMLGEAWYNPAAANLSKGRNSFTIKDWDCNNWFDTQIRWRGARSGSATERCGEHSFSIEPNNVGYAAIWWQICQVDVITGLVFCKPEISSYID
jgi:hypothetical protein